MQVLAYLEAFADQYSLRPLIRFSTQVVRLEQSLQSHIHAEHEQSRDCSGKGERPKMQTGQATWRVISEPASSTERQVGRLCQVSPYCPQLTIEPRPIWSTPYSSEAAAASSWAPVLLPGSVSCRSQSHICR